jgi:hypothetical protein
VQAVLERLAWTRWKWGLLKRGAKICEKPRVRVPLSIQGHEKETWK